jgi:hypothetical protein
LPATTNQDLTPRAEKIRRLLSRGYTPGDIADRLAPDDPVRRNIVLTQIRKLVHEPLIQQEVAQLAKAMLMIHTPEIAEALIRRASKGNIPAIKLAMEASGFYNPRTEHHHSGKIEIELKGIPRPARTVDEDNAADAPVYDADVVEE